MKKINIYIISFLIFSLSFFSCSGDKLRKQEIEGKPTTVRFTLNSSLRASGNENSTTPTPALEREKKIDKLFAVVYKTSSGIHYKTIECTAVSGSNGSYEFDNEKSGNFYFYLIANPDEALKNKLLAGPTTPDDLGMLIATQSPGDSNTAENFLMTSDKTNVAVKSKEGTTIANKIKLSRVVARFDFYNKIEGLKITKITFKKRYTSSHLFAQIGKMEGLTSTDNKEYEGSLFDNGVLKGTVYSYETDNRGETYFTLEATYQDTPLEPQEIRLENLIVKRNHLYNIVLHELGGKLNPNPDPSKPFGELKYDIEVVDWGEDSRDNVTMDEELALKPLYVDFAAELPKAPYMNPYLVNSPKVIYTTTKNATEVILSVGTYIREGSIELKENTRSNNGITLTEDGASQKDPKTGKITRKYKLTFPKKEEYEVIEMTNKDQAILPPFTSVSLVAKNFSGKTIKEFQVKHGRIKMPIEYLSEGPINKNENGFTSSNKVSEVSYVRATTKENIDKLKNIKINGIDYHFPRSNYEWNAIIPRFAKGKSSDYCIGGGENVLDRVENHTEWITIPNWMFKDDKGLTYYNLFSSDFKTIKSNKVTYAVRFQNGTNGIGNLMAIAYKYEWDGDFKFVKEEDGDEIKSYFKITCRYLGANYNGGIEGISKEDFWTSNNTNDISRTFYAFGNCWRNGEKDPVHRGSEVGAELFLLSLRSPSDPAFKDDYFYATYLTSSYWASGFIALRAYHFPIWLFSDK